MFLVGVQVDPHLKSLHLTLAYQFDLSHKETLKALIASTIIAKPRSWVIKLYSREATTVHRQVTFFNLLFKYLVSKVFLVTFL